MPTKQKTVDDLRNDYESLADKVKRFDKDTSNLIRRAELQIKTGVETRKKQLETLKAAKLAAGNAYRSALDKANVDTKAKADASAKAAADKALNDAKQNEDAAASAKADAQAKEQAAAVAAADEILAGGK